MKTIRLIPFQSSSAWPGVPVCLAWLALGLGVALPADETCAGWGDEI